jgi:hypothetical protein
MVLHCRLSSEGRQRRINTKKGPLVHQKQLRKKKILETPFKPTTIQVVSTVIQKSADEEESYLATKIKINTWHIV